MRSECDPLRFYCIQKDYKTRFISRKIAEERVQISVIIVPSYFRSRNLGCSRLRGDGVSFHFNRASKKGGVNDSNKHSRYFFRRLLFNHLLALSVASTSKQTGFIINTLY